MVKPEFNKSLALIAAVPVIPDDKPLYFADMPPKGLITAFHQHIRKTNRPDTFPGLSLTPPPNDMAGSVIIDHIELDSKKGIRVRCFSAKCKGREKFFKGKLIWSKEDGLIRIIGHECARATPDSAHNYERMIAEDKKRLQHESDTQFIFNNIDHVPQILNEINKLRDACFQVERWRACLNKPHLKEIVRVIINAFKNHGRLTVNDRKTDLETGKTYFEDKLICILSGNELFNSRFQPVANWKTLHDFFYPLNESLRMDRDRTILEILDNKSRLSTTADSLRTSITAIRQLHEKLLYCASFFASDNLLGLKNYGTNSQIEIRLFQVRIEESLVAIRTADSFETSIEFEPLLPILELPPFA